MWSCKWTETIVAIVIIVLALWPNILGMASKWIVVVAALILLVHAWSCRNCEVKEVEEKVKKRRR